jgi:hypothetical protein
MQMKNVFIHHVYFWLKNADSADDTAALVAGLKKLAACTAIQHYHIGKPAATSRDVIDGSYALSWCLLFANKNDQDNYQTDPIHLQFIASCKHLWSKVVVYDSIDVE